jgi:hypothetical protein
MRRASLSQNPKYRLISPLSLNDIYMKNKSMIHALDDHKALGERAFAANLWIDGTAIDDTYQGDATEGPWVVFDIDAQTNIAGPFTSDQEARDTLLAILDQRCK